MSDYPPVPGVRHSFVDTDRLRIHLAEAGPEDGEPLLLLHGWPQHWYEWRGFVPLMSDRYRMLMPDLRGLGWSEVTERGYEKEELARDQIALLDALGIERVNLIGHDWGGFAGFLLCLLAPERVERYLVTNIVHPWPRTSVRQLANVWRLWYQVPLVAPVLGPRFTRIPGAIKRALKQSGPLSDADAEAFEAPLRQPERAKATSRYYRAAWAHDFPLMSRGHWREYRLTVPTLGIFGADDPVITPRSMAGYEPYADDMRIEFVDGVGHFINDVRPELVAQRALDFFAAR